MLINNADLSKRDLHILGPSYLKKRVSRFIEVITEDKVQEIAEKLEVSNSKEEKERRANLQKEKRNIWATTYLFASYFYRSSATVSVSGLSALSISARSAWSTGPVSSLSAPFASIRFAMPMPNLSTLSFSAGSTRSARLVSSLSILSVTARFAMFMPGLYTLSGFVMTWSSDLVT